MDGENAAFYVPKGCAGAKTSASMYVEFGAFVKFSWLEDE